MLSAHYGIWPSLNLIWCLMGRLHMRVLLRRLFLNGSFCVGLGASTNKNPTQFSVAILTLPNEFDVDLISTPGSPFHPHIIAVTVAHTMQRIPETVQWFEKERLCEVKSTHYSSLPDVNVLLQLRNYHPSFCIRR